MSKYLPYVKVNNIDEKIKAIAYLSAISGFPVFFETIKLAINEPGYSIDSPCIYVSTNGIFPLHVLSCVGLAMQRRKNYKEVSFSELLKHDSYDSLVQSVNKPKMNLKVGSKVTLGPWTYTVVFDNEREEYSLLNNENVICSGFKYKTLTKLAGEILAYPGEQIS